MRCAVGARKPGSPKSLAAAELAADRLLNRWFERAPDVGLHTSMSREDVERWAHEYLVDFPADPLDATRSLTTRIMDRIAEKLGASRLVDTTPANARKADRLEPIYPDSTVVVVTRDGRDVAASFVSQSFGPDDVFEALDQWEQRMIAHAHGRRRLSPGARPHDRADGPRGERPRGHAGAALRTRSVSPSIRRWSRGSTPM